MSHYEISPKEREDEERRDEHEFGVQEMADQDERDKTLLSRDVGTWHEKP